MQFSWFRRLLLCAMALICLTAMAAPTAERPTVLVFGDSLSAAYGLNLSDGWVALLDQRLQSEGYPHRVINASLSGETTSGGIRRLPAALEAHHPSVVILELGANNGLRGQPIAQLRDELAAMIGMAKSAGAEVLVLGMRIPSNYGPRYTDSFYLSFSEAAEQYDAALLDFFLQPVALNTANFQADGIHPNAAAQPVLLDHVWPALEPLLNPEADQPRID